MNIFELAKELNMEEAQLDSFKQAVLLETPIFHKKVER